MLNVRLSALLLTLLLALAATTPAKAEFTPDPSNPPKTTFGSGTR